jgi:hypothetical protein
MNRTRKLAIAAGLISSFSMSLMAVAEPVVSQPSIPVVTPTANAAAGLQFNTNTHDFGRINDEAPVKKLFTFKNISQQTINVVNVRSTCGCTAGAPSKRVLAPGEEGSIEVTFNPQNRRGLELKTVTVETDFKPMPNYELHIQTTVLPRLVIEPSAVWFGEVPFGKGGVQEVSIVSRFNGFAISEAKVADDKAAGRFKIESLGADSVDLDGDKGTRVRYRITMLDGLPIGNHNTPMVLTSNDPKHPTISVSLAGRVVGELNVTPERLLVRHPAGETPFVAEAIIASRNGTPVNISSVELVDAPVEMSIALDVQPREPGSKSAYRIIAAGITPKFVNEIRGSVRIRTDSKDMAEINLPFMGLFQGAMPQQPVPGVGGGAPATPPQPK